MVFSRMRVLTVATLLGIAMIGLVSSLADESSGSGEWQVPARAARKKNPVPADDQSISAGKVFYTQECLACHGEKGKGDGSAAKDLEKSPGDLSSPKLSQQSDGALFYKITEGRKPMPGFEKRFSDTERWQIVNYIRTFAPKQAPSTQGQKRIGG